MIRGKMFWESYKILFRGEYYYCTYCLLDFCKEHSENPITNLKPEIIDKEYIEKNIKNYFYGYFYKFW